MRLSYLLCVCLFFLVAPALAQSRDNAKPLGTFGLWTAHSLTESNRPVCYMLLNKHFPPAKKFKRGPAYLMITQRPAEDSKDVVSYTTGYSLKPDSDVTVTIGKKTFDLFTKGSTAWSRDTATDHALTMAIRGSGGMKITGVPTAKGQTVITDTLDLKGASAAYQAISKACGVEIEPLPRPAPAHKALNKKH